MFRFLFAYHKWMGGERGSTTRMREQGKICCFCHAPLAPPFPGRERTCTECDLSQAIRRLDMRFEKRQGGWHVSFQELTDSRVSFRNFTFADAAKVEELVSHTATRMLLDDWHLFEDSLRIGLGTVTLALTERQYRQLLR